MRPLVIYHKGCKDGFGAAWVLWRMFGETVDYLGAAYGDAPPDVKGRRVYMVDFSYKRDVLKGMIAVVQRMTILDHHKTAKEDLEGLNEELAHMGIGPAEITFDMKRSGIGLAWDYLHPITPRPDIVNYVEDRDLWQFDLPDSKEINAYLQYLPYDFEAWEAVYNMAPAEILLLGKEFLRATTDKHNANIDILMSRHLFHGYEQIPFINHPTEGISEVMHFMLERTKAPFCVGWRIRDDGKLSLSFRSVPDFDCSEIAKRYGGGGHKNASGAEIKGMAAIGFLNALLQEDVKK